MSDPVQDQPQTLPADAPANVPAPEAPATTEAPQTPPPAAAPAVEPEPNPTDGGLAEATADLVVALEDFINVASAQRAADREAAIKRAGGDIYKAERGGFKASNYTLLGKAEEFLRAFAE
jgi:hypothetical protein